MKGYRTMGMDDPQPVRADWHDVAHEATVTMSRLTGMATRDGATPRSKVIVRIDHEEYLFVHDATAQTDEDGNPVIILDAR